MIFDIVYGDKGFASQGIPKRETVGKIGSHGRKGKAATEQIRRVSEDTALTNVRSMAQKMEVSIEFHRIQRVVTNTDSIDMPITGRTKVSDAFKYVKQQYPALRLEERMIITVVNRKVVSLDRILRDNDTVSFLPIMGGG